MVDVAPDLVWKSERAYAGLEVTVEVDDEETIRKDAENNFRARHKDLGSLKIKQGGGIEPGNVALIDVSAKRLDADGNEGERILSAEQKGEGPRTQRACLDLLCRGCGKEDPLFCGIRRPGSFQDRARPQSPQLADHQRLFL